MKRKHSPNNEIQTSQTSLLAMAASYCLGVFNDNYFKQAGMLLAVAAGMNQLQGWAAMLFALPFILFSAHGGWCADRFPKKRVVVLAKALEVVAMLIGAAGLLTGSWPCILSMVFLMGLQSTFFSPALNGSVPEIYPVTSVPRINAILKLATTLAILAGVAVAGISLDQKGINYGEVPFGVLVVAVVAVAVAIAGFIASLSLASRPAVCNGNIKPIPWFGPYHSLKDLMDICRDRQLFLAICADTYFYFIASIVVLVINALGIQQFAFSQTQTSMLSISLMLGICGGSFLAARLVNVENWSALLVRSASGIAAGFLLSGMTILLPESYRFWCLVVTLTTTGIAGGLFLIPVTSQLQIQPAASEKGRVLGAAGFCSFSAILISGLLYNLLESYMLPSELMRGLGVFAFLIAFVFALTIAPQKSQRTPLTGRILRKLLSLRYSVEISGLEKLKQRGKEGILFLPNHPALIDPVIVMSAIHDRFSPRPLSDADQVNKPVARQIMKYVNPITLPKVGKKGRHSKSAVLAAMNEVADCLKNGDNILFYPAGHLKRSTQEDLAGNSGVEFIIQNVPDVQIVLVRTTGLWGSSFSRANGKAPSLVQHLRTYVTALIMNGLFFMPKRKVTLEFVEDNMVQHIQERSSINRYLESFYNEKTETNTHIPYYWWQGRQPQQRKEVTIDKVTGNLDRIPESIQLQVRTKLEELVGTQVDLDQRLANDLGLDSLTILEMSGWLESEFGVTINDIAALESVRDCILAAGGQLLNRTENTISSAPKQWFLESGKTLKLQDASSLTEAFLHQAAQTPRKIVLADRIAGTKTYRDIVTAIFALLPTLRKVPGERIGIMLPATVSSAIVYLAVLFSGKTPVMFNWTVGIGNMAHGLRETGVSCIISAHPLCTKVEEQQGISLKDLAVDWLYLDEIASGMSTSAKVIAFAKAIFCRKQLAKAKIPATAAILFTSGSEASPKAVPLSHENILTNLQDFCQILQLKDNTRLLGMLPPFHSLGLVGTIIMPLCLGLPTVYHANPTEPVILAGLVDTYKVSMVIATPTFLNGILQAGNKEQLQSLRLAFTGAEKCPEHILQKLREVNPGAELCEGYGITECSPLVSINAPGQSRPGTIGRILPSVDYAVVSEEMNAHVNPGERGLLLVRGPSIFAGYLNKDADAGFCDFEGKRWYQTGDYVHEDKDRNLVFCGRKKRFIKIAGEMISLPAIENTLLTSIGIHNDSGPVLAVEAAPNDGHPEIVLFTTEVLKREYVNSHLKQAGLSALHNIRRLIHVEKIPVLGTGKTDYKLLQQMLVA
jgi:acyl-CoA synthetase (AMP-forming)/AMP-acid ligase II/1-acyl-sn-glycerol-3-phosphate acyltransferase/acyl carrier protein